MILWIGWFYMEGLKELGWVSETAASVTHINPFTGEEIHATLFWVIKSSWGGSGGWVPDPYGYYRGYYVVPAIAKEQYESGKIAKWQIEYYSMYAPIVGPGPLNTDADLNDDDVIDVNDWNEITVALWKTRNDSDWANYEKYDLSKDGKIDGNDLLLFMAIWNNSEY